MSLIKDLGWNEKQVVDALLHHPQAVSKGILVASSLMALLRDSRQITNRFVDSGYKVPSARYGCWLGVLGYLVFLEQIGLLFRPRYARKFPGKYIHRALHHFSELGGGAEGPKKLDAIYAVRCALAHNYSIFNRDKKKRYSHRFLYFESPANEVVELPKHKWHIRAKLSDQNETRVNFEKLGDLVESIYERVYNLHQMNKLKLVAAPNVALSYFTFSVRSSH